MKNRLAMFDLDGTLFDTLDINYLSYKQAVNKYGYELDYNYFQKECCGRFYKDFLPSIVGNREEIFDDIHKTKKELYKLNLKYARVNEHLLNIADGLKNTYYTAVVTSASRKNCMDILEHFDVVSKFDIIITHDDVEKHKPDPEGYLKAMAHFGIPPKDSIIFEDSEIGLKSAKASGANIFMVNYF